MQSRSSILIVEDETDLADVVCYHLEREGYTCRRAADGERALAEASRQPPDLIILDRMLPRLSGDEVARRLRRDTRTSTIPIIMLTARAQKTDIELGEETGADEYITKPFDMDTLIALVKTYLVTDRKLRKTIAG